MGQAANEIASIGKLLTDRWLHRRQLAGRCSSTISFWHLRAWGFNPRACAPYRARTKGKTESGVGYVKNNAIAGHSFETWEAFEAHPPIGSARSPKEYSNAPADVDRRGDMRWRGMSAPPRRSSIKRPLQVASFTSERLDRNRAPQQGRGLPIYHVKKRNCSLPQLTSGCGARRASSAPQQVSRLTS